MRMLSTLIIILFIASPLFSADDSVILSRFNKSTLIVNAPSHDKVPASLISKMDVRVTVDFQDVDLVDAIDQFQKLTGINVVIGSELRATNDKTITLKAKNMKATSLVKWIKQLGDVHATYMNEAIYFSLEEPVGQRKIRMIDVSDLIMPLKHFPGPTMKIPTPGGEDNSLIAELEVDQDEQDVDDIIEVLQDTLEQKGVNVE